MRIVVLLITFISIVFAQCEQAEQYPILIQQASGESAIKDTFKFEGRDFHCKPLYIGAMESNINIPTSFNDALRSIVSSKLNCQYFPENECLNFEFPNSSNISIFVDTTQTIKIEGAHYSSFDKRNLYILSYPIFILNKSDKNVGIGSSHYIAHTLEQGTDYSLWVNIDRHMGFCGHTPAFFIPSNSIIVSAIPIYDNLKSEKLKLKLYNVESNTFHF